MTPGALPQNPFPGLRPFTAEESARFFGRDEQIGEALDRLMRQKLLAVVGMSGCGKSSLVTAGMVPALEMGLAGDPIQQWRVEIMRPGDGPLRELERCLGFGGGPLAERTYGLREAVKAHLPANENLLLVVDQFEEVFPFRDRTREGGGSEADLFISYLLSAAQDPAARVYVVLTMRSDYLGECAKFHGLPEALNDGQYLVPRMTRAQLQEAIENPLEAIVGADGEPVQFHPGLVQKLLNDCDEEPDNLPLLQHLLRRLFEEWQQHGAAGQITLAMARDVGELSDALNQDAERVFQALSSEQQHVAEVIFRRITESRRQAGGGTGDRPVRSPQTVAHVAALTAASDADVRAVIGGFEQRGLLVVRRTGESDKVDLPHECLCLKWNRLKAWIEQEAQDAKALRFLADSIGKSHLTGSALTQAVAWQQAGRLKGAWAERYLNEQEIRRDVDDWVTESQRRVTDEHERAIKDAERIAEEQGKVAKAQKRVAHNTKVALAAVAVVAAIAFVAAWKAQSALRVAEREREKSTAALMDVEKAERETRQTLIRQLNNTEGGGLALSALDALSRGGDVKPFMSDILESNVTNNAWIASVGLALDAAELEGQRSHWVRDARAALAARLSATRRIGSPPSRADDEKLNVRTAVGGGTFTMGSNASEETEPQHEVTLSPFQLQEHEVTNEEYWRFDPTHDRDRAATLPVVNVSWYEAAAYAVWLGGSLPTEAQWEFAARGVGDKPRTFPWGEEKPTRACNLANFKGCREPGLRPVKTGREGGKTPEGVYDLAGNAREWCRDWYDYYPGVEAQSDPLGPPTGWERVVRGGAFADGDSFLFLRGADRQSFRPSLRVDRNGFRVVWSSTGGLD